MILYKSIKIIIKIFFFNISGAWRVESVISLLNTGLIITMGILWALQIFSSSDE